MKRNISLPVLTIGHFLIDLACHYFYFTNFPQSSPVSFVSAALLYNFLAFALQAPIGYFFDKFRAKHSTIIGILFVLCGYSCGLFQLSITGLIFCGFGNALYHVGGSIGIARTDKKGLRDSGIFVSSGALGISIGSWLATGCNLSKSFFSEITVWILLLLVGLLFFQYAVVTPDTHAVTILSKKTRWTLLLLTLFSVGIRSFGGFLLPTAYKELFAVFDNYFLFSPAIISGFLAFLGKFSGGCFSSFLFHLLARLFPGKGLDLRSSNYLFGILTLLTAILFLSAGNHIAFFYIPGILCFHAVMPVTLFELYCILPDHPGFSMGLSTFVLFLGYLPSVFSPAKSSYHFFLLCILILLSVSCMAASLIIYRTAHGTNKGE